MKVLLLTRDYQRNGGAGTYVCDVSLALAEAGHEVRVICTAYDQQSQGSARAIAVGCYPGFDAFHPLADVATTAAVLSDARAYQPDIVFINAMDNFRLEDQLRHSFPTVRFIHNHLYCPSGIKQFRSSLQPCMLPITGTCVSGFLSQGCWTMRNPLRATQFFLRALEAVSRLKSAVWLAVGSEYVKNQVMIQGVPEERIAVIPYFVRTDDLPQQIARAANGPATILFTGRVVADKGLVYLLEALARLSTPWQLIVDGDGPDLEVSKTKARELGIAPSIVFAGWAPPAQHRQYLASADIVAAPSLWPEPFGLVGIEAMAQAKPVVAFRSGGIPEWLEEGATGLMADPGDVSGLAHCLDRLLNSQELRQRLGNQGRARAASQFSVDRHLAGLLDLFERTRKTFSAGQAMLNR